MGKQAVGTILDTVFGVGKIAAATVCQSIQRTIAEQTAKGLRVCARVAGKVFTVPVLEKIIGHCTAPLFYAIMVKQYSMGNP
jgi:hypothetical protein